jgi:hypothetical protein
MRKISELSKVPPSRSRAQTIFEPSGDHWGPRSSTELKVSCVWPVPPVAAVCLALGALGPMASCGDASDDGGDGPRTRDEVVDCLEESGLEESGLEVVDGGGVLLSGKPGITVEGGSALLVVFDSSERPRARPRTPSRRAKPRPRPAGTSSCTSRAGLGGHTGWGRRLRPGLTRSWRDLGPETRRARPPIDRHPQPVDSTHDVRADVARAGRRAAAGRRATADAWRRGRRTATGRSRASDSR